MNRKSTRTAGVDADAASGERGRDADRPSRIPLAGWVEIFNRVRKALIRDHANLIAAGLSMYALLAVFPSTAAAISVYGMFASPDSVIRDIKVFVVVLPPGTWNLFAEQLHEATQHASGALSVTAGIAILVSLWSARSGMGAVITAANIAYSEPERRGFLGKTLLSIVFTAGAVLVLLTMLLFGVVAPGLIKALGIGVLTGDLIGVLRWVVLWLLGVGGLTLIYRYAPARAPARWRWVTPGSLIAASLWLLGSLLFALYVRSFGTYGKTYGTLGAVIILLLWFYLSSFAVVLGAVINAEMERQTRRDTTEGPEKPIGQRGAHAADTVGERTPAR